MNGEWIVGIIMGEVMAYLMDNIIYMLLVILAMPFVIFLLLTFLDNCWSYALKRFVNDGGYILMRRSKAAHEVGLYKRSLRWWLPHFLHMDTSRNITHWQPTNEEREYQNSRWYRFWTRLPHFRGYVKNGDDE